MKLILRTIFLFLLIPHTFFAADAIPLPHPRTPAIQDTKDVIEELESRDRHINQVYRQSLDSRNSQKLRRGYARKFRQLRIEAAMLNKPISEFKNHFNIDRIYNDSIAASKIKSKTDRNAANLNAAAAYLHKKDIRPASWAASVVYQYIDLPPEDVLGIWTNFDEEINQIPFLVSSNVVNREGSAREKIVQYEWDNEQGLKVHYTLRLQFTPYLTADTGKLGYRLDWRMVPNSSTFNYDITGYARFQEYKGGTILAYDSVVTVKRGWYIWVAAAGQPMLKKNIIDVVNGHKLYMEELKSFAATDEKTAAYIRDQRRDFLQAMRPYFKEMGIDKRTFGL